MHNEPAPADAEQLADTRIKIIEGIARKRLVTARYNEQTMILAPHALFARHGDLFVSALNVSKNWRSDDERRLGQFKLAGLAQVTVSETSFQPLPAGMPFVANPLDEPVLVVA